MLAETEARRADEITDYHLSHETGVQVIASLRARLGGTLPAILVSGDTSQLVQGLVHDEEVRIVSKPLQAERLLALIGELLARGTQASVMPRG